MMDESRELWNAEAQGRDAADVAGAAAEGLRQEWARVWDLPVPFFQRRFEAAGLGPTEMPPLDEIPRTTKADLRADDAEHPPFGSYRVVGLEQALRLGSSTGTTGVPTMIFYGPKDLEVFSEIGTRNLWRHGLRRGDRFTHSWPQGIYPTNVTGGRSYLAVGALEISVGPPFTVDMAAEHLRIWQLLRPTGFMMTGSQLQTYEEAGAASGIELGELLKAGTLAFLEASCQFERPRQRVETAYEVQLRNLGGASEVPGFATSDCRYHTGLHAAGDHFVVQACDPVTGREVVEGERGTLVVSAFGVDALFLRYDIEDIVTVASGPCPCGETGPRYTLLGRGADAVTIDERMLLPLDVQLALEEHGAPEFQFVRDPEGRELRVRVEAEEEGSLQDALREALGVPVSVEAVAVGSLPRSSFKPRRVSG